MGSEEAIKVLFSCGAVQFTLYCVLYVRCLFRLYHLTDSTVTPQFLSTVIYVIGHKKKSGSIIAFDRRDRGGYFKISTMLGRDSQWSVFGGRKDN